MRISRAPGPSAPTLCAVTRASEQQIKLVGEHFRLA
jgi:hypothetical protein